MIDLSKFTRAPHGPGKAIGGTAISSILGLNPWSSPAKTWQVLTGRAVDEVFGDYAELGKELQPYLVRKFTESTGLPAKLVDLTFADPAHPHIAVSPDGIVEDDSNAGLELKTFMKFTPDFGPSGSETIPVHMWLQVQMYMGYFNSPKWYLIGMARTSCEKRIYCLYREEGLYEKLVAAADDFWEKYVKADLAPAIDESEECRTYLIDRYKSRTGIIREATPDDQALLQNLATVKAVTSHLEKVEAKITNVLISRIAGAKGIKAGRLKLQMCHNQGKQVTAWKKVHETIQTEFPQIKDRFAALVTEHTVRNPYDYPLFTGGNASDAEALAPFLPAAPIELPAVPQIEGVPAVLEGTLLPAPDAPPADGSADEWGKAG